MKRAIAAALLLAVSAMMPAAAQTYVVRHLDTPEGVPDPDLLPKGKATAERLVTWFAGKRLAAIYISDFRRTRQTAAPLAAKRGLTPKVYDPTDTSKLIAAVRGEPGPVLIVGHSNTVPDIVEQLGGTRPPAINHPDFGDIWTVKGDRTTRVPIGE